MIGGILTGALRGYALDRVLRDTFRPGRRRGDYDFGRWGEMGPGGLPGPWGGLPPTLPGPWGGSRGRRRWRQRRRLENRRTHGRRRWKGAAGRPAGGSSAD